MSFGFGRDFRITVFGESHGACVGAVVEGCPAGLPLGEGDVQRELDRRRPGRRLSSTRDEGDRVRLISGIMDGRTNGGPITMLVENQDVDSSWYEERRYIPRPGHSDFPAYLKYGGMNDYRGGGFFSGRMTAPMVMGGAVAKRLLSLSGVKIIGHIVQIGGTRLQREVSEEEIEAAIMGGALCADPGVSREFEGEIERAAKEGDSVGGVVECRVLNLPPGIGEPFFDSVESVIAHGVFSIPGVKGVEFGAGFDLAAKRGSESNDGFLVKDGRVASETNRSGGVLGGLTTGMPLLFRVAMKPTPSIRKAQRTVDLRTMEGTSITIGGRHDPCIAVRAVPVVEGIAAVCLADLMLRDGKIPRRIGGQSGN
ncbi:MAG: chorismate synthase [Candidatus Methanosuratincola sp.]